MGRYIDDILQPGEKVLYSTNAHWIFYWPAIISWIAAITSAGDPLPPSLDAATVIACLGDAGRYRAMSRAA